MKFGKRWRSIWMKKNEAETVNQNATISLNIPLVVIAKEE